MYRIWIGACLLTFGFNASEIVAAIHGMPEDHYCSESHHSADESSNTPCHWPHRTDCSLCQLLAATVGKILLIVEASEEGIESSYLYLTSPDQSIQHSMIHHCPARGPPIDL